MADTIDDLKQQVAALTARVQELENGRRGTLSNVFGRNPLAMKYASLGAQVFSTIKAGKSFISSSSGNRFFPVVIEKQGGITLNGSPADQANQPVLKFHPTEGSVVDKVMYLQDSGLSVYISPHSATANFVFGIVDRDSNFSTATGFLFDPYVDGTGGPWISYQVPGVEGNDIFHSGTFINKTKAGIPSDSDVAGATSGMCVLDTTNSRIYFRVGTTWKYAALT